MQFLNDTKEVCYLTQIVIRLFEDTSQHMDNPRRFRVEILFSAGATATPLHMAESTREADTTRLDTDPLFTVGRDGLTCKEVEDFFDSIISEGGHGGDDASWCTDPGTLSTKSDSMKENKTASDNDPKAAIDAGAVLNGDKNSVESERVIPTEITSENNAYDGEEAAANSDQKDAPSSKATSDNRRSLASMGSDDTIRASNNKKESKKPIGFDLASLYKSDKSDEGETNVSDPAEESEEDDASKGMSHKTFYMTVALGTLLLGAGCLVMALSLTGGQRHRRRYTAR
jgi:inositol hexakisphosphate/diphosphoinositol-pentakisphosphate kinase